jgi:hypothetical protein
VNWYRCDCGAEVENDPGIVTKHRRTSEHNSEMRRIGLRRCLLEGRTVLVEIDGRATALPECSRWTVVPMNADPTCEEFTEYRATRDQRTCCIALKGRRDSEQRELANFEMAARELTEASVGATVLVETPASSGTGHTIWRRARVLGKAEAVRVRETGAAAARDAAIVPPIDELHLP